MNNHLIFDGFTDIGCIDGTYSPITAPPVMQRII